MEEGRGGGEVGMGGVILLIYDTVDLCSWILPLGKGFVACLKLCLVTCLTGSSDLAPHCFPTVT